ncbi:hypothetical protein SDC9_113596 [bioreactor metagenome]|uniref:Permease n=1 Tax=bioreactor metagenome TaxID=1076179 RepID=A0A645BMU4_9ZZZZ
MGFVLSWEWALFRIVAGLIMVFGIATFANKLTIRQDESKSPFIENSFGQNDRSLFINWISALKRLIIDTIPAYVIVVLLLGALRAWLFPAVGPDVGNSIIVIIGLAIAGTLFAIPTAAEIPIVQTLMSFGLGVGPAATLLMTLPAVSLPSLLIVKRAFPKRILVFVAVGVAIVGIVSGIVAGYIF